MDFSRKTSNHLHKRPNASVSKCDISTVDTRTPSSVHTASRNFDSYSPYLSPHMIDFMSPRRTEFDFVARQTRITAHQKRTAQTRHFAPPGLTEEPMRSSLPYGIDAFDPVPIPLRLDSEIADDASIDTARISGKARKMFVSIDPLAHSGATPQLDDEPTYTTLMLRDIPHKSTRNMLLQEITDRGFLYDIDFLYLPIDIRRKRPAGYCFVNLTSSAAACRFRKAFHGTVMHGVEDNSICHIAVGNLQGLLPNVEAYRAGHVVSLSEEYQPLLFKEGTCWSLDATTIVENVDTHTSEAKTCVVDNAEEMTLMLRGIPNKYTRQWLMGDFAARGVLTDIDFVYLPIDLRHMCNVGYCFVNVTTKEGVDRFLDAFEGLALNKVKSGKICSVTVARIQGQEANINLYRNTLVMTMRHDFRPQVLKNGLAQPFPAPTISRQQVLLHAGLRDGVSSRSPGPLRCV